MSLVEQEEEIRNLRSRMYIGTGATIGEVCKTWAVFLNFWGKKLKTVCWETSEKNKADADQALSWDITI